MSVTTRNGPIALSIALVFVTFCLIASSRPVSALSSPPIAVVCSSPVIVGNPSTCVVTVTGSPTPTGTVDTFTTSGSGTFAPSSCMLNSGSCQVMYTPTTVSGSPHTISATYQGDGVNYSPSTSTGSGDGSVSVNQIQSSLGIGCVPSTVQVGASSTCTATVTGYSPSGSISFLNTGGTAHVAVPASCVLTTASQSTSSCQVSVASTGAGGANIQASYPGDVNNIQPPSATASLTISKASSFTTVICAPATVIAGQQTTCTATVKGYSPTGIITWQSNDQYGVFSANPCTLVSGSCGVSYTAKSSATITASYAGDSNNTLSTFSFSITANVNEMIQITVANSGPVTSVTLSGCSVLPTTVPADGAPHPFQASSGCTGIVASLPPAGADSRYLTAGGQGFLTIGSCAANSCQTFSATIYYQVENAYQATPKSPAAWSTAGTIEVDGTALGVPGQAICTVAVATGAGQFSCQGWTDYSTQTTMGALQVSATQRWATAQSSFTDTAGGSQHNSNYFSQVLEEFQYSLFGSTTAPSSPRLNYTAFGAPTTFPLVGSATSVWLDSGSGWSVPATLAGSTANERWVSQVTAGAATAGSTVSLAYFHQFLVSFAYSVTGGGSAYAAPSVSFSAFGASSGGVQGWVDAGSTYSFTNPLAGSSTVERWFSSSSLGVVSGAGTVSALFYHQYAFVLNFSVSGGGFYDNPRMNFTSLGSPAQEQVNATQATFWVDSGTSWGLSPTLPSSSGSERWITKQTTSGTAFSPLDMQLRYYHQYLGTLHYSINGQGGAPPVPRLNYTSLGAGLQPLMNGSSAYWMDAASTWSVPLILPGGHGERWLSNVTVTMVAGAPFTLDAQYTHQFFVEVGVSTSAGGAVGNTNAWHDQYSSVVLNETTANLWSFAYWKGATPFSYNGTTLSPALQVTGAANETAIFFPGLNISTDHQGAVAYSYGSISGTVPAGTNATVYVPPGRSVTLTAMPSTVEITFDSWAGGVGGTQTLPASASRLQTSLSIQSPYVVHASFSVDYTDIRTFAVAALGVFIAAVYVFVIKRGFTPKLKQ